MKNWKNKLNTLLGLFILIVLIVVLIVIIVLIIGFLKSFLIALNSLSQNQTTLLIAVIPSTVSILGLVFANFLEKTKDIDFKNREKKKKLMTSFLKPYMNFTRNQFREKQMNNLCHYLHEVEKN